MGDARWRTADGAIVADACGSGWLRSGAAFADYVLKGDFRTGADGNSGIFLRSAAAGQPHITGRELRLQARDPTTNLDFRNIKAAAIPQ